MNSFTTQSRHFKGKLILFLELCSLDMKQRTAGTALGYVWLYLNPLISIGVIWAVFHFGLKATATGSGTTFSLLIGLMSWYFIQDILISGMGAITEKPYLVKKIKFDIELLPLIKVANSLRIYFPFMILTMLISFYSGGFAWSGLLAFLIAFPFIILFLTSVVFLLATAVVFYRDLQSIVSIVMQLVFWATPIIWAVPESPRIIQVIEEWNPIYFIVKFYRFCSLGEAPPENGAVVIFIVFVVVFSLMARTLFSKLKEQFADVI